MATLANTQISTTFEGLLKTEDNADLTGIVRITDGIGTTSPVYLSPTKLSVGVSAPVDNFQVVDSMSVSHNSDPAIRAQLLCNSSGEAMLGGTGNVIHMLDILRLYGTQLKNDSGADIFTWDGVDLDFKGEITTAGDINCGADIKGKADTNLRLYSDKDIELRIDQDGDGTNFIKFRAGTTSKVEINESGDIQLDGDIDATGVLKSITSCELEFGNVAHGVIGSDAVTGTNVAGRNLTISAGQGTGIGEGGTIDFKVAPNTTSGSSTNPLELAMSVRSDGLIEKRVWVNKLYVGVAGSGAYPGSTTKSTLVFGDEDNQRVVLDIDDAADTLNIWGPQFNYLRLESPSTQNCEIHMQPDSGTAAKGWKIMATNASEQLALKNETTVKTRFWKNG